MITLKRILLIDDDKNDNLLHTYLIRDVLNPKHISNQTNVEDAIKHLINEQHMPDLIFLDINMPKYDGWDFLDQYDSLKTIDKTSTCIVMLTTSENPKHAERAKLHPLLSGFYIKPLTDITLKTILKNHFDT